MKLVDQISPTTCGQACVATILGITIEEAIDRIGHSGITSDEEIWRALGTERGFSDGKPSVDVVAIQKHRDPKGDREHWTVSYFGETLDPAHIGKRLWPVTKHAVIDWIPTAKSTPTADYLEPVGFEWSARSAKIRKLAREFAEGAEE